MDARLDERALALLAEIRAAPEDDAPRLVLADHLATRFPEHAALIVAQCHGHPDAEALAAFLTTLPDWVRQYHPALHGLQRGFFEDLRYCTAEQFLATDPDLLYRIAPSSTALILQYASKHLARLVALPALRRYRDLTLSDTGIFVREAELLARCPHLEQLEHLGLCGTALGDDELAILARSTAFPRLLSLDISTIRDDMRYGMRGLRELGTAAFAPTLCVLALTRRWLGDEAIDVIAQLPALVDLDLASNGLTDAAAHALALLPHQFTSLTLAHNDFTDAGRHALVERFGERVSF